MNTKLFVIILVAFFTAAMQTETQAQNLEVRTWTSANVDEHGKPKQLEAALVDYKIHNGTTWCKLRKPDGNEVAGKVMEFSSEDREYMRNWFEQKRHVLEIPLYTKDGNQFAAWTDTLPQVMVKISEIGAACRLSLFNMETPYGSRQHVLIDGKPLAAQEFRHLCDITEAQHIVTDLEKRTPSPGTKHFVIGTNPTPLYGGKFTLHIVFTKTEDSEWYLRQFWVLAAEKNQEVIGAALDKMKSMLIHHYPKQFKADLATPNSFKRVRWESDTFRVLASDDKCIIFEKLFKDDAPKPDTLATTR